MHYIPGWVSSGATDGGLGNLGEPAEGASGETCRSASLWALDPFVGPGQHTAAAAEKSLTILPGDWALKPLIRQFVWRRQKTNRFTVWYLILIPMHLWKSQP